MARWRPDRTAAPEPLTRYDAAEWTGGVDEWRTAALAWLAEDRSRRLPLDEYGDAVSVIRESARIKMELAKRA